MWQNELAIFKESYVQNTINVGTNNSGSNIGHKTLQSVEQTILTFQLTKGMATGTQGYNVGGGVFLGINGNNGSGSFSIENGLTGDELLWDGNTLSIRGSIEFTNTPGGITNTLSSASLFSLRKSKNLLLYIQVEPWNHLLK